MTDEDVIGASAYQFTDEVLVEVTTRDTEGYVVVNSYQFERTGQGLRPKQSIEAEHRDAVVGALTEKDYVLGGENAPEDGSG